MLIGYVKETPGIRLMVLRPRSDLEWYGSLP